MRLRVRVTKIPKCYVLLVVTLFLTKMAHEEAQNDLKSEKNTETCVSIQGVLKGFQECNFMVDIGEEFYASK